MMEKTMKRATSFLAMLMLVFAVTFGFQANAANAANANECQVTQSKPCNATIDTGETFYLRFDSGSKLRVTFINNNFTKTAQILPTIGSQAQQPFNLQPGGLLDETYSTGQFSTATFANQSVLQDTSVDINVAAK
ncbi:MAG: hypothetical protein F6J86_39390 [Symploca sp. SIO1B1]|nr:hypothetical protein [Symploca sp. SIO1B1]